MCVEIGILARQELDVEEMTYHTFLQLRESGGSACSSIDIHWNPYDGVLSPSSLDHGCWVPAHLKGFLVNYNIQIQTTRKYFILPFTYFRPVRHCLNSFESWPKQRIQRN